MNSRIEIERLADPNYLLEVLKLPSLANQINLALLKAMIPQDDIKVIEKNAKKETNLLSGYNNSERIVAIKTFGFWLFTAFSIFTLLEGFENLPDNVRDASWLSISIALAYFYRKNCIKKNKAWIHEYETVLKQKYQEMAIRVIQNNYQTPRKKSSNLKTILINLIKSL